MTLQTSTNRPTPATPVFPPGGITRPFSRVGILGAGETGMHIARSLLDADIPVTVYEPERELLDAATASARTHFQNAVLDGELTASQRDRCVALLAGTINLHHLKDCDVIVDTLNASPEARDGVLRRLNELARTDAVLLTCTADGDASRTAPQMRFPENVLGMRWAAGAGAGQWELVPVKATSERALATATRLINSLA
ncbi:hypothetical protein GCM10027277_50290 [Pseudoduganella ginsengisoli]|nr:3-hydroxyacyl-CoA dehydrogenase NAD-binding domain-containing protein [Pseudoduganella ginsengisoli]